jgi:preprotein translocase subunit SecD
VRQNITAWLVGILVLAIFAGYVDISDSIGVGPISRDTSWKQGLDLKGGIQLVLQAEPRGNTPIDAGQLEAARTIIEDRANGLGASEPVVQVAGNNRILVELPGISNLDDAVKVIQGTAFLEFIDSGTTPLNKGALVCTDLGCPSPEQLRAAVAGASPTAVATPAASPTVTGTRSITSTGTTAATPAPTVAPTAQTTAVPQATMPTTVYHDVVTGDEIDGSKVQVAYDQAGIPRVAFGLKGDGPRKMADYTSKNVGKYMPIVLDKKVISSPSIQGAIPGGQGEITGVTLSEAQALAIQLKYGALPVGLKLLENRLISATLGTEAINKSLVAGIIGLGLVVLFMLVYYRLPGALADVALIIYALVAAAVFKLVPVTLTLAGIAGFILSIGMAVDANVLIFARLKEELRSGKTLAAAVEAGFDHAWPSIRDSNASTLMTCAILFWFGSTFGGASIIKGFALTLAIGVLISLFSAILVTRTFLRAIIRTNLAHSKWAFGIEDTARPAPTDKPPSDEEILYSKT